METQVIKISWKTSTFLAIGRCLFFLITFLFGFISLKANNTEYKISEPAKYSDVDNLGMYIAEGTSVYVAEGSLISGNIYTKKSESKAENVSSKHAKKLSKPKLNKPSVKKTINREQIVEKVPAQIQIPPTDNKSFFSNAISHKEYGLQVSITTISILATALYRLIILFATILFAAFSHNHNYLSERFLTGNFQRPPPTIITQQKSITVILNLPEGYYVILNTD